MQVIRALRHSALQLCVIMSIFGLYDYLEWRDHPLVESNTIALVRILLCRYVGAGLSLSLLLLYSLVVVLSCCCTLLLL